MTSLERAALDYCAARARVRDESSRGDIGVYVIQADWALHELMVVSGFGCECDPGSCPSEPAEVLAEQGEFAFEGVS